MNPAVELQKAASHLEEIDQATARGDSNIQSFYDGSTVFITGGSGFIGKQLIEKLFRSCNIKKICMLLRAKKKKPVQERLVEILKDPVFNAVRKQKPDFTDRIQTVNGDISEVRLGVSDEDWKTMADEIAYCGDTGLFLGLALAALQAAVRVIQVNVIFHVAATTKFDENIRDATFINVRGTREALQLGISCKNLRSFVHVSTAYSHATSNTRGGEILEQFHDSPVPPETLIQMAETVDRGRLDDITSALIKGWPNTYTFTKAVAEEQVRMMSSELPVCIVRPSIVTASYREPCPAWLDISCAFSASGIIIGSGLGLNHVMQTVKGTDMSIVPVDFVNNALISAGWEVGTRGHDGASEIVIYNMVTSTRNKILWGKLEEYLLQAADFCPTPMATWKSFVITTQYYYMFLALTVLLHFIPAMFMDAVLFITGKEPRFVQLYKKIHKLSISLSYFMNNLHKMDDKNLTRLQQKLSKTDRKIFNFDMAPVDWWEYVKIWCLGVRMYILKDELKDTDKAIRKQFWLGVLNYFVLGIYGLLLWVFLYSIFGVFRCFI